MWFYLIAKTSERCMNNHYKNIKLNPKLKAINSEKAVKKNLHSAAIPGYNAVKCCSADTNHALKI